MNFKQLMANVKIFERDYSTSYFRIADLEVSNALYKLKINSYNVMINFETEAVKDENSNIAVRCDCSDFTYTWEYYNFQNGCLYLPEGSGTPSPPSSTNPRNTYKYPGICKHIYFALVQIFNNRI